MNKIIQLSEQLHNEMKHNKLSDNKDKIRQQSQHSVSRPTLTWKLAESGKERQRSFNRSWKFHRCSAITLLWSCNNFRPFSSLWIHSNGCNTVRCRTPKMSKETDFRKIASPNGQRQSKITGVQIGTALTDRPTSPVHVKQNFDPTRTLDHHLSRVVWPPPLDEADLRAVWIGRSVAGRRVVCPLQQLMP